MCLLWALPRTMNVYKEEKIRSKTNKIHSLEKDLVGLPACPGPGIATLASIKFTLALATSRLISGRSTARRCLVYPVIKCSMVSSCIYLRWAATPLLWLKQCVLKNNLKGKSRLPWIKGWMPSATRLPKTIGDSMHRPYSIDLRPSASCAIHILLLSNHDCLSINNFTPDLL